MVLRLYFALPALESSTKATLWARSDGTVIPWDILVISCHFKAVSSKQGTPFNCTVRPCSYWDHSGAGGGGVPASPLPHAIFLTSNGTGDVICLSFPPMQFQVRKMVCGGGVGRSTSSLCLPNQNCVLQYS